MPPVLLLGFVRAADDPCADGCERRTPRLASLLYASGSVSALRFDEPQSRGRWLRPRVVHLSDRAALALAPGNDLIDQSPSDAFSVRAFAMES